MIIISRYLALLGMLATVAWFLWNPNGWTLNWEPIVAFIFSLSGFIASDITAHKHSATNSIDAINQNDAALFRKLIQLLPSNGPLKFIHEHDFLIEFRIENMTPFYEFYNNWDNAEHKFFNAQLENLRSNFYQATEKLLHSIGKYTSGNAEGYQAVRHDSGKHNPVYEKRYEKEARIINAAADEAYESHQELIRYGMSIIESSN